MKIAVTGATGFIGRYIVERLLRAGHDLNCWHRPTSDRCGMTDPSLSWIEGDLTNAFSMQQLTRECDALVHAALWKPGHSFRGGEGIVSQFAEINVIGTLRLIEAAMEAGVQRIVYLSTCAVHEVILEDRPLDEAHPLWATSHYGAHKAAVEKFVHSYGLGSGLNICALRPSGVYGLAHPAGHSKWYELVRQVVAGEDIVVEGGGKEVHAGDVASAVELLLQAAGTAGLVYNCCDRYISRLEVATMARSLAGSSSQIEGQAPRPKHQIVTERLRSLGMTFGGTALLEETIAAMIAALPDR
jgi:nucleoside-diphosphate-sugar epimerase